MSLTATVQAVPGTEYANIEFVMSYTAPGPTLLEVGVVMEVWWGVDSYDENYTGHYLANFTPAVIKLNGLIPGTAYKWRTKVTFDDFPETVSLIEDVSDRLFTTHAPAAATMFSSILIQTCELDGTGGVPCLMEALGPDSSLAEFGLMRLERYRLWLTTDFRNNIDYSTLVLFDGNTYRVRDLRIFETWPEEANHIEAIVDDIPRYLISGIQVLRNSVGAIDSYGQPVDNWELQESVSGLIRQLNGGELIRAATYGYEANFRLLVYPPENIQVGDRISIGDTLYQVQSVDDVLEAGQLQSIDLLWISASQ